MRTLLSFLFITLIFVSDAFGQSRSIVLTKKKHTTPTVVAEGKIITIRDISGNRFKGHFKVLNGSRIAIKSDTISFDQIVTLRIKLAETVLPGLGFSAGGILGSELGIMIIGYSVAGEADLTMISIVCAASIFTVGCLILATVGITWVFFGKQYSTKKWDFRLNP
jgi:hypothetical protein